jgi:capsular exopolysaccharide synthesis family protein
MEKEQFHNNGFDFEAEQSAINVKEIFYKYFQFSWLFILSLAITISLSWLYLRYKKPVYSVSSTLLIRNDMPNRSGGGQDGQDMFSDLSLFQANTNRQNEILTLTSRSMMERVVHALKLEKSYQVEANVKTTSIYTEEPFDFQILTLVDSNASFGFQIHFTEDWSAFSLGENGKKILVGEVFDTPQGKFKIQLKPSVYSRRPYRTFVFTQMSPITAALVYSGGLEVKPANDQSTVLSLTYTHENTLLATAILNELTEQYNSAAIEDKNEMNRRILSFINDRLRLVEGQLDTVESNLQNFRTKRDVINLEAQSEMYFGNASEVSTDMRKQEVQLQVVKLLENYLNDPAKKQSLVPSTLGIEDPTLVALTSAYNQLVVERLSELQTGATVTNPVVLNLDKNIEDARLRMLQNLQNIEEVYQKAIESLKSRSSSIRSEISSIPERQRLNQERVRAQEIKQNLYLYLMQKREESEIAQASTISNSRIIDAAIPVPNLVGPFPIKIYGIGFLVGFFLPILIIYIRDLLNDKVTTRQDITKGTSAPILAEIGHSEDEQVLLFPGNARGIVAEQLRILRSNLRFVLGDNYETPTIMVTSSFSGEGKSFVSTNLGATFAISGKKTVILEFDLRKPKIIAGLGLPKGHGLTNYLVGGTKLEELAQSVTQVENLYVIPCGPVPPNPSEILLTQKIAELFKWLKQEFDAIVIDTAPVGLVSDAFTLGQYADSTIYVIRQRYTFKKQLSFIQELYAQKKLPKMGVLVNDVISQGSKGYYGYGGGRYGYGYGYGYGYSYGASYFEENSSSRKGILGRISKGVKPRKSDG